MPRIPIALMSHSRKHHQQPNDGAPQPNGHAPDAPPAEEPAAAPQPGDAAAAPSAAGAEDALREELNAMRDRHLRTAAEFDNYRKRVERERAESYVRAQAQLAEKLLDALDDLQRIADFDPATTSPTALHEGAEMVERKFLRALEAAGLETVEAEGRPFDPTVHEAITTTPTDQRDEDDTVADVFQKGYRFKGVLLRPARVRVKKYG
jgi:molecular chaperone GrpE